MPKTRTYTTSSEAGSSNAVVTADLKRESSEQLYTPDEGFSQDEVVVEDAQQAEPSSSEVPSVAAVVDEVKEAMNEAYQKSEDVPSFRTDPGNSTHLRYNIDNLLSTIEHIHQSYRSSRLKNIGKGKGGVTKDMMQQEENKDSIGECVTRCIKACTKSSDDELAEILSEYAMKKSPNRAWWDGATHNWLLSVGESVAFPKHSYKHNGKVRVPFLPISLVYAEAERLTNEALKEDRIIKPDAVDYVWKLAKHFYLTMLEALRHVGGSKPTMSISARISQCEKCLKTILAVLEDHAANADSLLEMIVDKMLPPGPDGQKISMSTFKNVIGSAMNVEQISTLLAQVPASINGSSSPEEAIRAISNQPVVKSMQESGGFDIEDFVGKLSAIGIVGKGTGGSTGPEVPLQEGPTRTNTIKTRTPLTGTASGATPRAAGRNPVKK